MVMMLWSWLCTRLPAEMVRADGTHHESGTEFEYENAIESFKVRGSPRLLVYRKRRP